MERYVQHVLFKVQSLDRNRAQVTPKLDYEICEYYIFQRWVQPAGFSNPGRLIPEIGYWEASRGS